MCWFQESLDCLVPCRTSFRACVVVSCRRRMHLLGIRSMILDTVRICFRWLSVPAKRRCGAGGVCCLSFWFRRCCVLGQCCVGVLGMVMVLGVGVGSGSGLRFLLGLVGFFC